jgi:soluble lytic murein transglycosylase-like protein
MAFSMRILPLGCLLLSLSAQATCWQQAGLRYGIEPVLLQAIAVTESRLDANAQHHNSDGSVDLGLMQINSRHLTILNQYKISQERLLNDPCINVMTGAWILAGFIRQYGYGWEAVGAYNAGNGAHRSGLRKKYCRRVIAHYLQLKNAQTQ